MKLLQTIRLAAAVTGAAAAVALVAPQPARAETMAEILARHDAEKAAVAAAEKAKADAALAAILAQPRTNPGAPTLSGAPTIILSGPLRPEPTPEENAALAEAEIVAAAQMTHRIQSGTLVDYWYDEALVLHRIWDADDGRWHEAGGTFVRIEP